MMRRLFLPLLLLCAGVAAAQSHAHHGHAMPMPMPPAAAASTPAEGADAHAGHQANGGQAVQAAQADHAGHAGYANQAHRDNPAARAAPYQVPPVTAADRAAAFPLLHGHHAHGDPLVWMVQADRLEYTQGDALAWSGKAWIGRDRGRLWLRSEGERARGQTDASLEALWGRPLDAWWDVLAGLRHDNAGPGPGPARDWLALGVQGLAPYKFEVQATAYLGRGGRAMLRAEAEYELLLTNRLILQPHLEAVLNGRADPARGTGAGLAQTSQGLRLRYEIRREFAPYLGYAWTQRHGGSAEQARRHGEPVRDHGWVAGVRFWF